MTFRVGYPLALWLGAAMLAGGGALMLAGDPTVLVVLVPPLVLAGVLVVFHQPRWGLLALLVAAYTYALEPLAAVSGLPGGFRVAVIVLLVVVLLRAAAAIERPAVPPRELVLLLAFFGALAVSMLVAEDVGASAARIDVLLPAAGLAFLLVLLLADACWLRRGLAALALSGTFIAGLAVLQQATGTVGSAYGGLATIELHGTLARSGGPFTAPNFFAQALLLAFVFALYLVFVSDRRAEKLLFGSASLVCLAGIATTYSRGGGIAVLVVALLVVALRRPRPIIVVATVAALIVVGLIALPSAVEERFGAIASVPQGEVAVAPDYSLRGRLSENLAALRMFQDDPLLGVGAGNYPVRYADYSGSVGLDPRPVREPHNLYLESLAETGVIGGLVMLAFLWATMAGAWRARKQLAPRTALLAEATFVALAGVLVTSIFLHAGYPRYIWMAFGLAWAARLVARPEPDGDVAPAQASA